VTIAPIVRKVRTKAAPERAFDVFANHIGAWWPKGNGVAARPLDTVYIEPKAGGRWVEIDRDGNETPWGKVLTWSPPVRLVLAWQLNADFVYDPELVTEVEIAFVPDAAGGTEVTLTHSGLERLGSAAEKQVASIASGWSRMVERFAGQADGESDEAACFWKRLC